MKKLTLMFTCAALLICSIFVLSFASAANPSGIGTRLVMRADADDNPIDQSPSEPPSADSEKIGVIVMLSIAIITIGSFVFYRVMRKKKKETKRVAPRRSHKEDNSTSITELRPIEEYREIDPSFDEEEFKKLVSDLYLRMQDCRMKRDFTELRPLLSDDVFGHYDKECAEQKEHGRTPVIEKIKIKSVIIRGFKRGVMHDHIKIKLVTSIVEYLKSDRSGRRVSGSREVPLEKKYEWDMSRRRENSAEGGANGRDRVWKLNSIKTLIRNSSSK